MGREYARPLYYMAVKMDPSDRILVESFDLPTPIQRPSAIPSSSLYSRQWVSMPVDVRTILHDQYVNLATWLHRNGAWRQMDIPF